MSDMQYHVLSEREADLVEEINRQHGRYMEAVGEVIRLQDRQRALEAVADDLLRCWDDSADALGPEWNGLAEHVERLRRARLDAAEERQP